jgi:hypothetical protein
LIVMLLIAGCSSRHHAAPTTTTGAADRASAECRAAVSQGYRFVNAQATTVGAIHTIRGGPANGTPWAYIFKGYPESAFAAWCWRKPLPGTEVTEPGANAFQSYVVGPGLTQYLPVFSNSTPRPGPAEVL